MQTQLADFIRGSPEGERADAILRKCVHCGFCLATCPTYQLLGNELDSPRGRLYLIKQVLEGHQPTERTLLHLDRCLTCRSCETTCPSGVHYAELADIGRNLVESKVRRSPWQRVKRRLMAAVLPRPRIFKALLSLGRMMRPVLPGKLAAAIPARIAPAGERPRSHPGGRFMVALSGCVQGALSPDINAATARVLDRIGIALLEAPEAGCCGALRFHLNFQEEGRSDMRALIDAWWPLVEAGAEAFVMTASGCGSTVKEYDRLLAHDSAYAAKAKRISAMTRDISEVIAAEWRRFEPLLEPLLEPSAERVAFHTPCSLQHAQGQRGVVEPLLERAGCSISSVPDAHLCCGSAGPYSLLQPEIARSLQQNKLAALRSGKPQRILTANIGCQVHLAAGSDVPVEHWIVALDRRLKKL